jgi:aspartate aminotransferase
VLIASDDMYNHTLVLNGVSKAYAMTGWRIGYAAGPAALIAAMDNIQSQSTSNPTSISQVAAETALNGDQGCIQPMLTAFKERQRFVVDGLNASPGLKCVDSAAIARLHAAGKLKEATDLALTAYLLDFDVAVVPGSAFGSEGCIRLSFATSMANLQTAISRIAQALA